MKITNSIIDLSNFIEKETIGKGFSGQALIIEDITTQSRYVAKITNKRCDEAEDQTFFIKEVSIHLKCKYPTILPIIGYNFLNLESEPYPTIVTKFMPNGSLKDLLNKILKKKIPVGWTETSQYIVLLGIAFGMKYIHSKNITHLDIKPSNILLDENFYPNICDFGFSEENEHLSDEKMILYKQLGTPKYMAPEIRERKFYNNKVDVYSFSIMMEEILTNLNINDNINILQIQSDENQEFFSKCISDDPLKRPNFYEISKYLVTKSFMSIFNQIDYNKIWDFLLLFEEIDVDVVFFHGLILWENNLKKESVQYFVKAAKQGNSDAQLKYADMLYDGLYVQKDVNKSVKYYKKSLESGNLNSKAMLKYAQILFENDETKEEAIIYYEKAADQDNVEAMINYADILYEGNGIQSNKIRAAYYYRSAANLGNDIAMFKYAQMVDNGDGINMNKEEAFNYYKQSAEKGNLNSMFQYAKLLENENKELSLLYYNKAANENHLDSMYQYALKLYNGDGIEINKKGAYEFFLKASNKNHSEAMLYVAKMLYEGENVDKNKEEAANFYKKAADIGNVDAMLIYGKMLESGDGIEINKKVASIYLKKAADQGNPKAMVKYSSLLYEGDGIDINKEESLHYCRMALEKEENDIRQFYMKVLYEFENEINEFENETNEKIKSTNLVVYKLLERSQTAIIIKSPDVKGEIFIPSYILYKSKKYFVTRIKDKAFSKTLIQSLSFSDDSYLMKIGDNVFEKSQIKSLCLPKSLQVLSKRWCKGVDFLENVEVDIENKYFKNINGFLMKNSNEILFGPKNFNGQLSISNRIQLIGYSSFYNCKNLSSIVINTSNLKCIDSRSFNKCEKLETVNIEHKSILNIGYCCFVGSKKLSTVTLKSETINILNYSFLNCISLTSIIFQNVRKIKIGYNAFQNCSNLKNFSLKNISEISIGDNCFDNGKSLETFELKAEIINLGKKFINNCSSLSIINIQSNQNITILSDVFNGCNSIKEIHLNSSSKLKLCSNCLREKQHLKLVDLNAKNIELNDECFHNCSILESIIIDTKENIELSNKNFGKCQSLKTFKIFSKSSLKLLSHFLDDSSNLENVELSGSNVIINVCCFKGCTSLNNFQIMKSGNIQIGGDQFIQCNNLIEIQIESTEVNEGQNFTRVELGQNCFSGAVSLKQIIFTGGNIRISNHCFNKCALLEYFLLFNVRNVTIDGNECINCKSLKSIVIQSTATIELLSGCFCNATNLDSIDIYGKSVIINHGCFTNCSSLEIFSITKSGDVKIGDNQFFKCIKLNKIVIESTIENETKTTPQIEFGQNCFSGANNLKEVLITGGNIKISKQCFKNCTLLNSIKFENVESLTIDSNQFRNFKSLTNLIIDSKSNVTFESYAFTGSKNLIFVSIKGTNVTLGNYCFQDCSSLSILDFSKVHRLELREYAFYKCPQLSNVKFDDVKILKIDNNCFNGAQIKQLNIEVENLQIEKEGFKNCSSISSLVIKTRDEVRIGQNAFEGCKNLKTVEIESNLQFLAADYCFYKACCLKQIRIKSNIISIGDHCFKDCTSFECISAPNVNAISFYKNSFEGVSKDIKYDLNQNASIKII